MYDVTFEELVAAPIREGIDPWMIFSDAHSGLHIADFHYSISTAERRDLQHYVTSVMNGVMMPSWPGIWTCCQGRILAYNSCKKIVIRRQLPIKVSRQYASYMLQVLNSGKGAV